MRADGGTLGRGVAAVAAFVLVGTVPAGCGGDDEGAFSPLGSDPETASVTALMARLRTPRDEDAGGPDFVISRLYRRGSVVVSDDGTEVVFGAEDDGLGARASDEEDSALALPGMAEVAGALDDAGVYAAWIFFDVGDITDDGPLEAPWTRGAVATSLAEDGDPVAYSVLWHDDEADAEGNADPLADAMDDTDRCDDPATVDVDGPLLVASCPYDGRWANEVVWRFPLGPLFS